MIGKELNKILLSAAFVIPTSSMDGWKELQFNKIPKNTVSVSSNKLKIEVQKSASPLIYKLPQMMSTKTLDFNFEISNLEKNKDLLRLEKTDFPEDFVLRVGLVAKGEKFLGWFQKKIAAPWVLELFNLAPKDVGLDKIYFHNVGLVKNLVGSSRVHPKSDLMTEEIVASYPENKQVNHILKKPIDVIAIWISVDGDDTKSSFTTEISELKINP